MERIPDLPNVAYAAGYCDDHGADPDRPEHELWRAVLRRAADDLRDPNKKIRADAIAFFMGDDLLRVMDLAGIDRDVAPTLRKQAMVLGQQPGRSHRRQGLTYQGETRTYQEWAEVTGLGKFTIIARIRRGLTIKQALTQPLQEARSHRRRIDPVQRGCVTD